MRALRHWSTRHAKFLSHVYQATVALLRPPLALIARVTGEQRLNAWLAPLEKIGKGALFDCNMCGECVLSKTGMTCPMNCGKRMRNGPCGGVREDGTCEVIAGMPCVWVEAGCGDSIIAPAHTPDWLRRLPPVEHNYRGQSTWAKIALGDARPLARPILVGPQPDTPVSALEAACRSERFLVTVEIAPPDSHDPDKLLDRAEMFRGLVDAINITDGAGANCHMSSVAAASILNAHGFEAICQLTCRDKNRIALQGDALGAAALGIRNVLCLTGDDVGQGDHPGALPVFDLDSVNLLATLETMRSAGTFVSGRKLDAPVPFFLGATANPFVPPYSDRLANLERKIDAGARFIQTQFCFDMDLIEQFMRGIRERGLHERARIMIGVGVLSTAKGLRWMAKNIPGVHVPDSVIRRIAAASDEKAEGIRFCLETIASLRRMEGIGGVHMMGHRNEATLAKIIEQSGLRT